MEDRGQAHTLEAFTAAILILTGVIFALNATAVTPLSASTSNQHIQNQQKLIAEDILQSAAENDSLRDSIVYWNHSNESFEGVEETGYYTNGGPPTAFGSLLNETFREDRIAFNVYIDFSTTSGNFDTKRLVFMGSPSNNAVSASRVVTIFNETELSGSTSVTLEEGIEEGGFYAPDIAKGQSLFNVLEVRIVVWRM